MKLSDKIDYIKWDANRNADNVGSAYLPADEAVALLDRLRAGILQGDGAHPRQISRRADPSLRFGRRPRGVRRDEVLRRGVDQRQHRSAFARPHPVRHEPVLPGRRSMGSHVSATPNHQTSNITPIKFRFDMACAGRLGMELQPKQMNAEEKAFARKAIESYKGYRDIVMEGDLYRIGTPYDDSGLLRGDVRIERQEKSRAVHLLHSSTRAARWFRNTGFTDSTRRPATRSGSRTSIRNGSGSTAAPSPANTSTMRASIPI